MLPLTQIEHSQHDTNITDITIAEYDTTYIVNTFGDMMYKLAMAQLNNKSDAFDVVQDVMLRLHIKKPVWNTPDHVKAWLIRSVINRCRDYNKSNERNRTVELNEAYGVHQDSPDYDLQEALANLPQKYKAVVYLHYYEGYKLNEIAQILKVGESGIKKRLVKAREMLKIELVGGEQNGKQKPV